MSEESKKMQKPVFGQYQKDWIGYRPEIKLLDCTVRDGGLMNDHRFDDDVVKAVYRACAEAGIDYMELGYKASKKIFSQQEFGQWKSQFVISKGDKKGLRKAPYAFTEQGVAMLSAVLKSKTAISVSVRIMNAFVSMRRFMSRNANLFKRVDDLEKKQVKTEEKIDKVFNAIEGKSIPPKQGIFYEGKIFDAWSFVSDLVRMAKKSIVLCRSPSDIDLK